MYMIANKEKVILLAILSFFIILVCSVNMVEAKRGPPKEVEPLIYNGVKYTAPLDKMGYVEAFNNTTGEKLREIKVYDIKFDPNMEADVQDIFITNLSIVNGKLIVINEAGVTYEIDIEGHDASPTSTPSPIPATTGTRTATETPSPEESGKIMGIDIPYFVGFLLMLIAMGGLAGAMFLKWRKAK